MIRPAAAAFTMICDDCGNTRPVENIAGIEWACERIGWRRVHDAKGDKRGATIGHRCPRCAAIAAAPPPAA